MSLGKDIQDKYNKWLENAYMDGLKDELLAMKGDDELINDAFYRNLSFGTGGLRGVIGAGTNRMNVYVVARASQGLSNYVCANFPEDKRSIAVSYDSRIKSDLFAKTASVVFAANGIKVHIYPELMPTPCLSFAVRSLKCAAGIIVTASHNPSKYNGYKVYGADGCQITTGAADEILKCIENVDEFNDVKMDADCPGGMVFDKTRAGSCSAKYDLNAAGNQTKETSEEPGNGIDSKGAAGNETEIMPDITVFFEKFVQSGRINYIKEEVTTDFIEHVKSQSVLFGKEVDKNVSIVYSPLNGTGLKPVLRALKESGFNNITVVKEQEKPDGNFPTCPYPNPEIRQAMELGIEYAKNCGADLLLATDPDCDRVGIAVKEPSGDYRLMTGNETGILLLDYVASRRKENGRMPKEPVFVKTIVTSDLTEKIAASYGVRTISVLTGFKYIGEQIGFLEAENKADNYIMGFEESYGYLSGSYVRDKDAVNASFLICEMFAYYKTKGMSLLERLEEIYREHGYCLNTLYSFAFEGEAGFNRMNEIMNEFRSNSVNIENFKCIRINDYEKGIDGLPKENVLKFFFEDGSTCVVRPSGTEPKLKVYFSVTAADKDEACLKESLMKDNICKNFV